MSTELDHDRGRGPELTGTRITVYNLLPYFMDPAATEEHICKLYNLSPEQVAAMRAYVLNNPEEVLAQHLKIEARIAEGNPPEIREAAKRTHAQLLRFKEWLVQRQKANEAKSAASQGGDVEAQENRLPSFRDWLAEEGRRPVQGP